MGSDIIHEVEKFLPQYLSPSSIQSLMGALDQFPNNIDSRMYSNYLTDPNIIYQGDGIDGLLVINLPDTTTKEVPSIILSNTCDIYPENNRAFISNICYAPIFNLEKYCLGLIEEGIKNKESLTQHINDIKHQRITQIFYLPKNKRLKSESIVFLGNINNIDSEFVYKELHNKNKLFTLSQYGHYLFLFKLSIHFCRLNESQPRDEQ